MPSKNAFPVLSAAFFSCFVLLMHIAGAQQASFYFSAGYNKAWYSPATIHVSQGELGNAYDLVRVKGDNKTHTPISALQLSYRLGYYCNDEQTLGIELNFDPVDYEIKPGQNITLNGTVNGIPRVTKTVVFSAKNGYHYEFDGANLMLFNIVRRLPVYHTNNRMVSVDMLIKGGIGPVMPHVQNSLPVDPVSDPELEWGGWNAGLETGFRVSIYRYGYLELAGKYDYANCSSINVYDGTASQRLSTYEAVASIGFTLPATRNNPLFYRQHIITIIPLFVDKKDKEDKENTQDSLLNVDTKPLTDIPEFPEIAEKNQRKRYYDSMALAIKENDSLAKLENDSLTNRPKGDSIQPKNDSAVSTNATTANDSAANKGGAVNIDSLENKMMQQTNAAPAPAVVQPTLTDKDKKRIEKKAQKDKKKLEKQQKKDKKKKDKDAEEAAKENAGNTQKPADAPANADKVVTPENTDKAATPDNADKKAGTDDPEKKGN